VHRPAWAAPIAPTLLVGLTVALWPWLGGWSFVVALLVSVLGSRALLGWFSLRAYRLAHVPLPAWRWRWPGRTFDFRLVGDSALAGMANLTTRLASVVLLGAVIPSLGAADAEVQLVAFVLHLAAPLVLVTTQWSYIFYHDWKRLEADSAAILARQLHRGLLAVGAWVAVGAWAVTALLVRAFTGGDGPWAVVAPIVFALAPAYLGLSIWTALQLRGFSRGEFVSQALSAAVVMGSVLAAGIAIGTSGGGLPDGDVRIWYITLAACPWIAVVAHAILARGLRAPDARAATTLNAWVQRLRRQRRPVAVWRARLAGPRAAAITVEVGRLLASRGQVLAWHRTLARRVAGPVRGPGDRVRSPARGERRPRRRRDGAQGLAGAAGARRRRGRAGARARAPVSRRLQLAGRSPATGGVPRAACGRAAGDLARRRSPRRRGEASRFRRFAGLAGQRVRAGRRADPGLRAAARGRRHGGTRRAGARLGRTAPAIELADFV
jgi:hypothetical protein